MRIVGTYKNQKMLLDVPVGMTVRDIKEKIKERLGITLDVYKRENKVLILSYAGADLGDTWVFSDLGILPGSAVKIQLRENIKPALYIKCSHNQETISVLHDMTIISMRIDQVRSMSSMRTGLPVGIFRLTTSDGREMFDPHCLDDYGVDVGHTIHLQTWDGWSEFLNMAIMGFTTQVISQLSASEVIARYQLKVALFIASHFGHLDLARAILKQGIRADEPTGYHPARAWCKDNGHIDNHKSPVHEATLCGQVGVLRLFATHDITCIKAKDGHGLEPLRLALRHKVKDCATFLLSKQWTKINISKTCAVHLSTYRSIMAWCRRAKERALIKYGAEKSSFKKRSFSSGPLISHGIFLDGFSKSPMTGKSKATMVKEEKEAKDRENKKQRFRVSVREILGSNEDPEMYFKALTAVQAVKSKQRPERYPLRWSRSLIAAKISTSEGSLKIKDFKKPSWKLRSRSTPEFSKIQAPSEVTDNSGTLSQEFVKLPPIGSSRNTTVQSRTTSDQKNIKKTAENSLATKGNRNETENLENTKLTQLGLVKQIWGNLGPVERDSKDVTKNLGISSGHNQQLKASFDGSVGQMSNISGRKNNDMMFSETSASVSTGSVFLGGKHSNARKKELKRGLFISKKKKADQMMSESVTENGCFRRPFFYHQGVREDQLVNSALEIVDKYRGDSSHVRAVKSMTLANSFSEKPWLEQVRLALNVTRNSLKRSVEGF